MQFYDTAESVLQLAKEKLVLPEHNEAPEQASAIVAEPQLHDVAQADVFHRPTKK